MLYTSNEVADMLRMSVATLNRERFRGKISYVQRTSKSKIMFTQKNIDDYLERITTHATPEYLSMVLNGHREPKNAEQDVRDALSRLFEKRTTS